MSAFDPFLPLEMDDQEARHRRPEAGRPPMLSQAKEQLTNLHHDPEQETVPPVA